MEISINALLERVDGFLTERETRAFRGATHVDRPEPLEALYARYPELSLRDAYDSVKEAAQSPRADDTRKAALARLLRFLARVTVESRGAAHVDAAQAWLTDTTLVAGARTLSVSEALAALPFESSRESRVLLEREAAAKLLSQPTPWARRVDTVIHTAADLGFNSAVAFVDSLTGRALKEQADKASALLKATDDAFVDLLAYALRRLDPALKPSSATLADVDACARATWLVEAFRREELQHAVTRCVEDLGLDPAAHGRVSMHVEPRPARRQGSFVAALRVPDEVRLYLELDGGLDVWSQWLHAAGVAQHRALTGRTLPLVNKRLGDTAVVDASGLLFASCLTDEGFLKRYARLPQAQAREAARLAAFRQLVSLRRTAALLPPTLELLDRGPVRPLTDAYVGQLSRALHADVPAGRWLYELDPLAPGAVTLDAWALEAHLAHHLTERFNEDWWRNPAAGRWFQAFASAGERDDAQAVVAGLGVTSLDLVAAGTRRVAVMGA